MRFTDILPTPTEYQLRLDSVEAQVLRAIKRARSVFEEQPLNVQHGAIVGEILRDLAWARTEVGYVEELITYAYGAE